MADSSPGPRAELEVGDIGITSLKIDSLSKLIVLKTLQVVEHVTLCAEHQLFVGRKC